MGLPSVRHRSPAAPVATDWHCWVMAGNTDLETVVEAARSLPAAESSYLEDDYLVNLQETVLDYQMDTKAVVRAL